MIYITNKHKPSPIRPTVYCGRGSVLGNPFTHLESNYPGAVHVRTRDEACERYEDYFQTQLFNPDFVDALKHISNLAEQGDVALECFCAPARCHCETIKAFIDS